MSIEVVGAATSPDAVASAPTGFAPVEELPRVSRSLARQAVVDTLASRGARVGLVWLALLAFFAVFSPFIASSHPLLVKMDGRWSSPLLRYLTPADALFLIGALVALVLGVSRRYSFGRSVLVLVAVIAVSAVLSFWLVRPPQNVDYSQYRQWARQDRIERALYTLIPYSPSDR